MTFKRRGQKGRNKHTVRVIRHGASGGKRRKTSKKFFTAGTVI